MRETVRARNKQKNDFKDSLKANKGKSSFGKPSGGKGGKGGKKGGSKRPGKNARGAKRGKKR